MPRGLIQVVTGSGAKLGPHLIDRVDYVMFTGSTHTGRTVARQAAERLIGCSMELGGKNAMIVLDDADIGKAVGAPSARCSPTPASCASRSSACTCTRRSPRSTSGGWSSTRARCGWEPSWSTAPTWAR